MPDMNCSQCTYYEPSPSGDGEKAWCRLNKRHVNPTDPVCPEFRSALDELLSAKFMPFGFPVSTDNGPDEEQSGT